MIATAALRSAQMSDEEYNRERAGLMSAFYGDSSIDVAAKRDQALALLFYRSGWTEDQVAKKEGRTRQWVSDRIGFGRFLNFASSLAEAGSLPRNLSVKKFLDVWEQTVRNGRNERIRFRQALQIMRSVSITAARRPSIGESIKELC